MTSETTSSSEWASFVDTHSAGDIVQASVTSVLPFGALVDVAGGIPGLLTEAGELSIGDTVSTRIKQLDSVKRRVSLVQA